jgi:hypothetical protein
MSKIGRNDPCPCGSGKKYKTCCLRRDEVGWQETPDSAGAFRPADRAPAIEKLLRFGSTPEFEEDRGIGMALFWGGRLEDRADEEIRAVMELEQTEVNFNTWFLFDMDVEDGRTVVDLFLTREGGRLAPGERAYLEKALGTHFRLYEVEEVRRDRGFRLKDLWSDETYEVKERAATHYFTRWDLMATRLMNLGGDAWVMDAGIYNFPYQAKEGILTELKREHRRFRRNLPGHDETTFFKRVGMLFNHWWLDWVVFRPLPKVVTAEGDEMVFTRVIFDVKDGGRVIGALQGCPDFESEDEETYVWLQKTTEFVRGLGTVNIDGSRLILETTSEERGQRGRQLLEGLAGDAIWYRLTEYQSVEQALKSMSGAKKPRESTIPPEMEALLRTESLDKHYRKWVDEKIPALGHRTPRDAVRLKTLRPKVVDLLKQIENAEARAASERETPYDFAWLWDELGLERQRGTFGSGEA